MKFRTNKTHLIYIWKALQPTDNQTKKTYFRFSGKLASFGIMGVKIEGLP